MQILTKAILVLLIIKFSYCARLKSIKKDNALKSVIGKIVGENKLRGFLVCNLMKNEKNPIFITKSKELLRILSTLTTVVQLHHTNVYKLRKFHRNMERLKRYTLERFVDNELLHSHLATGDNVYLIIIINF